MDTARSPLRLTKVIHGLVLLIIALALLFSQSTPVFAQAPGSYATQGRAKFTQRKYDEAIEAFRKHLRKAPKDFNVWNELGAAYYHTGQPRKALRYLKQVERKTTDKSYNYYYQGLCYEAVDTLDRAKDYFNYAALRFSDEYAARSTYEMGTIEYKARNKPRIQYWLTLYLQRYPTGVYAAQSVRLLQSLREDKWLEDVEGTQKPNQEEALFKYNKLSLTQDPHFWFIQGGWQFTDHSGFEPAPGGDLKARNYQDMAAVVNSGVGMGPYRQGNMTAFAGYTYRQLWITEQDRISEYMDDKTDLEYFPLRGDLLERRHQFYVDFRKDVASLLYYGVFARYEFARVGSSLFPSPDNDELRKVLKISDTQLVIPWIGASFLKDMRTLAYLYLRKEINEDSPDHSNKTYELGLSGASPVMSLGISHEMDFPEQDLEISVELFRYEFIYNDFWLDYKREGMFLSAEHQFIPRWYVSGLVGYYKDNYVLTRIKNGGCGAKVNNNTDTTSPTGGVTAPPTNCFRNDTGLLYQAGVYWNWTQFQRFSASFQQVENKNPQQKEFDESKQTIQVTYTMAFPSVKRVTRFVDRYADTAFTKEAE